MASKVCVQGIGLMVGRVAFRISHNVCHSTGPFDDDRRMCIACAGKDVHAETQVLPVHANNGKTACRKAGGAQAGAALLGQ